RSEEGACRRSRDRHPGYAKASLQVRPMARAGDPAIDHLRRYCRSGIAGVHPDILRKTRDAQRDPGALETGVKAVVADRYIAARHAIAMLPGECFERRIGGEA